MSLIPTNTSLPLRKRIRLEIITSAQARYMLENCHYLHRVRVGRQINYAIFIDGIIDGVITYAHPFMSSPILNIPSDEIVEFARLYLYHNIPHSATCAIGKSLKRIKRDWEIYFPKSKPIKLIVSWSDSVLHKGTIYKASNFIWLKRTDARNRVEYKRSNTFKGNRKNYDDYNNPKDCWIYWL